MLEKTQAWYNWHIPPEASSEFGRFLARGAGLARYITGSEDIRFKFVPEASVSTFDRDTKTVCLPQAILDRNSAIYEGVEPDNAAITGVFDSQIIKAAITAAHSPKYARDVVRKTDLRQRWNDECENIYNTFEHIYAQEVARGMPYGIFSEETDCLIAPQTEVRQAYAEQNLLGVASGYIAPQNRDMIQQMLPEEAYAILEEIRDTTSQLQRAELARRFYEFLYGNDEQQPESSGAPGNGALQPDARGNLPEQASLLEDDESIINSPAQGVSPTDRLQSVQDALRMVAQIEQEMKAAGENQDVRAVEVPLDYRNATWRDLAPDDRFRSLGRALRQLRVTRWQPTIPDKYGDDILDHELFRAKVDRRVMGDPIQVRDKTEYELAFLCDLSGSMSVAERRVMFNAVWGCCESLKAARMTAQIYGYSSDSNNSGWFPAIVNLGNARDADLEARLNAGIYALDGGTPTSYAIDWALENAYTPRRNHKLLAVITDGVPNDRERTRKSVQYGRERCGVNVLALSLNQQAWQANERLFGDTWNIDCSGNRLDTALQELVMQIGQGRL